MTYPYCGSTDTLLQPALYWMTIPLRYIATG